MGLPLALQVGASFLTAGMTASAAKEEAKAANAQMRVDIANERIKGAQDANARQEEYLRNESTNRVLAAAATGGSNMSFDQGISPYNKEVANRDLATMGYNTELRVRRAKYQIRVNKFNAASAATAAYGTAAAESIRATADAINSAGSLAKAIGG